MIVRIPEAAEREHVDARIAHNALEVSVDGWGRWRRRLNHRVLEWEDGHQSRAHVDPMNSTWILTRDAAGRRCVQFILAQWTEGASKMAIAEIEAQKAKQQWQLLVEDADPFQTFDLVEADMFLRAGAVFKQRSQLSQQAGKLVEELEREAEKRGALPSSVHSAPFAELWADDAIASGSERQIVTRDDDGAEVEEAAAWWARTEAEGRALEWTRAPRGRRRRSDVRRRRGARRRPRRTRRAAAAPGARERRRANRRRIVSSRRGRWRPPPPGRRRERRSQRRRRAADTAVVGRRLEEMMGAAEAREAAAPPRGPTRRRRSRSSPPPPPPPTPRRGRRAPPTARARARWRAGGAAPGVARLPPRRRRPRRRPRRLPTPAPRPPSGLRTSASPRAGTGSRTAATA